MRQLTKLVVTLGLLSVTGISAASGISSYSRTVNIRGIPGAYVMAVSEPTGSFRAVNINTINKTALTIQGFESDLDIAMNLIGGEEIPARTLDGSVKIRVGTDSTHYQDVMIKAVESADLNHLNLTSIQTMDSGTGGFSLHHVQEEASDKKGAIYLTFSQQG